VKHRLTEPFGKAGLTVSICALVLALVGGAYAAGGLTKSQEKQVTKIAKKYAGKSGATGPAGAAGTNGTNGTNGKDGTNGAPGESVTVASAGGSECEGRGGTKLSNGTGTATACNGKEGEPGAIHPGETLPSEATETGAWSVGPINVAKSNCFSSCHFASSTISFTIPLAAELDQGHIAAVISNGEEVNFETGTKGPPVNCLGSVSAPEASPGFLCVYVNTLENTLTPYPFIEKLTSAQLFTAQGASTTGALLHAIAGSTNEPELVSGWGSWAVTAE
jgi:hypothetical protein